MVCFLTATFIAGCKNDAVTQAEKSDNINGVAAASIEETKQIKILPGGEGNVAAARCGCGFVVCSTISRQGGAEDDEFNRGQFDNLCVRLAAALVGMVVRVPEEHLSLDAARTS